MSHKSGKIAELIRHRQGQDLDAHYLAFFDCFNEGLYYESHDVLEELWLASRAGANYGFYKGLIQFAGAFVHLQKGRLRPAASLLRLSRSYLERYPDVHEHLDVNGVLGMIEDWLKRLEASDFAVNPLRPGTEPRLALMPRNSSRKP